MVKYEKGSPEALEWGKKMRERREAKGAGMGSSKVAPKKPKKVKSKRVETTPAPDPVPAPVPVPVPVPAPKQQKVVLPVLGPNGELPEMNAEQRNAYDMVLPQIMNFDIEYLNELQADEVVRSKNPEETGWGHSYDVGMYIALLKALHNKSMSGGKIKKSMKGGKVVLPSHKKQKIPDDPLSLALRMIEQMNDVEIRFNAYMPYSGINLLDLRHEVRKLITEIMKLKKRNIAEFDVITIADLNDAIETGKNILIDINITLEEDDEQDETEEFEFPDSSSEIDGGAILPPRPPNRIPTPGPTPSPTPMMRMIMHITQRAADI